MLFQLVSVQFSEPSFGMSRKAPPNERSNVAQFPKSKPIVEGEVTKFDYTDAFALELESLQNGTSLFSVFLFS